MCGQGCEEPSRGLEEPIFPLLAQTSVQSSLRHLRSLWMVNSANYFALCVFSEVLHNTGLLCGRVAYGVSEIGSSVCIHSLRVTNWQKRCEIQLKRRKSEAHVLKIHYGFIAYW